MESSDSPFILIFFLVDTVRTLIIGPYLNLTELSRVSEIGPYFLICILGMVIFDGPRFEFSIRH